MIARVFSEKKIKFVHVNVGATGSPGRQLVRKVRSAERWVKPRVNFKEIAASERSQKFSNKVQEERQRSRCITWNFYGIIKVERKRGRRKRGGGRGKKGMALTLLVHDLSPSSNSGLLPRRTELSHSNVKK